VRRSLEDRSRQIVHLAALSLLMAISVVGTAMAAPSSSPNYRVNEYQFGSGGALQNCSGTYCAKMSAGDLTVGSAKSNQYSARFGFNTTDEPLLEILTTPLMQDMGVLTPTTTGTASTSVKIRNYLSDGYVLQITGNPPSQGTSAIKNLTTPTTSQAGAEQFGINLVANTTPNIGTDPVQVPDSSFSFGVVEPNYNQTNKFMYQNGDVVARSLSSTGQTDYTISFIANITAATAGGRYQGEYSAVVVPTF
jgi:hypothetical protein